VGILIIFQGSIINAQQTERPKIGLVLSGGAALGFAHIGALKLIDSLGIPIDYIAGTSMGGIMGGLYSIGYTAEDIEKISLGSDWMELFTDAPTRDYIPYLRKKDDGLFQFEFGLNGIKPEPPDGLVYGQKISLLLSGLTFSHEHIKDFDDLPIPFRCTAVDLITGKLVVLRKGSLAKAIRSTLSIPSLFSPVEWGDSLLVDGGLLNNVPIDVVLDMGADIVIAVTVSNPIMSRDKIHGNLNIVGQSMAIMRNSQMKEQSNKADILIKNELVGITVADFQKGKIKRIIDQGGKFAYQHIDDLIQLKKRYNLKKRSSLDSNQDEEKIVFGISITGNTTMPFNYIYKLLDIAPKDTFNYHIFEHKIRDLEQSDIFESLDYETRPVKDNYIRLLISVKEKEKPLIHGINITGHKNLSFSFIYKFLGIRPGDIFDKVSVEKQITELYSLGYFEKINYEITPKTEKSILLDIKIKEKPQNKLHIGIHYDDFYKLVGIAGVRGMNFIIPGMQIESDYYFAGFTSFKNKILFPSRMFNLMYYPYVNLIYKNIPIDIFDIGVRVASYNNRSTLYGGGIGILPYKFLNASVEYNHEYMDVDPRIAIPDTTMFPIWKDELHKFNASLDIDYLDDVLFPLNGFLLKARYESSLKQFESDIDYVRWEILWDYYHTYFDKHTIRYHIQYGNSEKELPRYKWFNFGGPKTFVGLDWNEVAYFRTSIFRIDYMYKYKKNLFGKLIGNIAPNYQGDFYPIMNDFVWGYGVGLCYRTPVGPIELTYSHGSNISVYSNRGTQKLLNLTIGCIFD